MATRVFFASRSSPTTCVAASLDEVVKKQQTTQEFYVAASLGYKDFAASFDTLSA